MHILYRVSLSLQYGKLWTSDDIITYSFDQLFTKTLFSIGLFNVKNTSTTTPTPKCIMVKHMCKQFLTYYLHSVGFSPFVLAFYELNPYCLLFSVHCNVRQCQRFESNLKRNFCKVTDNCSTKQYTSLLFSTLNFMTVLIWGFNIIGF